MPEPNNSSDKTFFLNIPVKDGSPVKSKILSVIVDKSPISILDIKKEMASQNEVYNYRTIWQHIQKLEASGAIVLAKSEHEAGKPVKVYLDKYLQEHKKEFKDYLDMALNKERREKFKEDSATSKKDFLESLKK